MAAFVIAGAVSALYGLVLLGCIVEFDRRAERKREKREKYVHLSAALFWVGLICGGIMLLFSWLSAAQDGSLGVAICFGAFVLLSTTLMLGWMNCYIFYDHKGFTQRNILGMQRSFTYDQMTGYRMTGGYNADIKLYACGKTITVDWMSANGIDFLQEARKGYARCNNGTVLPNTWESQRKAQKQTGKGSFSAHVHNPGEFLAIFIMMLVFIGGGFLFISISLFQPITQEDCQLQTVAFSQWQIEKDTLILLADGVEERFEISGYEKYLIGFEELTAKCDGKTQFTVWSEHYEPEDEAPYYAIRELSADGVMYRTFGDSTNAKREGAWAIVALFGGMLVIFLGFSWLTYKIGCNPKKYPKWLVHAFFKKGSISF